MSKYEIITIIINSIMALTSVVSCISSSKSKRETLSLKSEIESTISDLKIEQSIDNNKIYNDGLNTGVIAGNVSGGVKIGPRE